MSIRIATGMAALALAALSAHGQVIDPYYATNYAAADLGSVPGVPGPYGGITFLDSDTLLIGGEANRASGAVYSIDVTRDVDNNITGFVGSASLFASAPNIDGGLSFGPGGVLFATGYPVNTLMQIRPGSAAPDRTIALTGLGVASSVGTLAFVPAGFAGAGGMKLASYNASTWYDVTLAADGLGTYDIASVGAPITIGGGPEGIVYIDDSNPLFDADSVLISEFSLGRVSSYEIDGNGDPVVASRRTFMTGLSGAEGATLDPVTGQFMFSTFNGGDRVVVVRGFVPAPGSLALLGVAGLVISRRRR